MSSPPHVPVATGAQVRHPDRGIYGFRTPKKTKIVPSSVEHTGQAPEGVLKRHRVVYEASFGELKLSEFSNVSDVSGATIIEGSPSVGFVSSIVANTLINALTLPLCAVITCPTFPAGCTMTVAGLSSPVRVHGDSRLVVFVSDFRLNAQSANEFAELLLDFAARHSCPHVFLIEGKPDNTIITDDGAQIDLSKALAPPHLRQIEPSGPFGLLEMDSTGTSPDSAWSRRSRKTVSSESSDDSSDSDDGNSGAQFDPVQLHFLTTAPVVAVALVCFNAEPLREGTVEGSVGAVVARAVMQSSVEVTALLIKAHTVLPDARAAATIISILAALVDTVPASATEHLTEDANELEARIKKTAQSAPPPPSTYGMYM